MNTLMRWSGMILLTVGLSACANNQQTGTFAGAAVGGVFGHVLGGAVGGDGGRVIGTVVGAVAGGMVGNSVGKQMDEYDRMKEQRAIRNTKIGYKARWHNPNNGATYEVIPVKNIKKRGRYCREYQTKVIVGGKERSAYGRACREPDGAWKIIS